jgi:hypothetical protein
MPELNRHLQVSAATENENRKQNISRKPAVKKMLKYELSLNHQTDPLYEKHR